MQVEIGKYDSGAIIDEACGNIERDGRHALLSTRARHEHHARLRSKIGHPASPST
jgi:hypothetical protein